MGVKKKYISNTFIHWETQWPQVCAYLQSYTFQHGLDGDRLFGYLNIHLEDFPIRTL